MLPFDLERISSSLASAAIDPVSWSRALDDIVAATNSRGAILLPVVGALPLMWNTPSLDQSVELYMSGGWFNRDERYLGTPTFLKNGVVTDDDCMPAEARKKSAFYQDFIQRSGLSEFAGVRVGREDHVWNLSLQRSAGSEPYSEQELMFLAKLSDQLDVVVKTSQALHLQKGLSALDAFEFSSQAALLLDRTGKVVCVNATAQGILGDDLQISGGRLVSTAPQSAERLNGLFKELFWRMTSALVSPLVLPKRNGGRLVIYAMRLPGMADSPLTAFHSILIITDSDGIQPPSASTLRLVYDLTPAEARLAMALRGGTDLAAYASAAAISKETVRNQLKSVFGKVGVSRQAELAAVLSALIPGK